jgi:hypothetical protein
MSGDCGGVMSLLRTSYSNHSLVFFGGVLWVVILLEVVGVVYGQFQCTMW